MADTTYSDGITPAYAGKSFEEHGFVIGVWDHPRVCGEKASVLSFCSLRGGSPPRMRGKVCYLGCISVSTGITPAYAGKRGHSFFGARHFRDHPRVCGEKNGLAIITSVLMGSPPRMRGKVRISGRFFFCTRDHPRVCGEKPNFQTDDRPACGSPPRMRGKGCTLAGRVGA